MEHLTTNPVNADVSVMPLEPSVMEQPTETTAPPTDSKRSKRVGQAKRLWDTKTLSREQWLEARKRGIGSSDAAAACGLNPHQSMLELWMIKTGRKQPPAEQPTENSYSPLYWGQQLEPLIAEYYQRKTGNKVRRVNAVLQHVHEDKSFMLANLDYEVVGSDEVQILECKSVGQWGTKHWKDGVPLYVLIQVQHQLAVTGKQAAHICVLHCGHEAKIYKVERNEAVIERIITSEKIFWSYVQNDLPPAVDASESTAKALQQLYPEHTPLQTVDFSEVESIDQLFDNLVKEEQKITEHQTQYDYIKHQIQSLMQDAEKAVFSNGSITWKRSKDSIILDQKALLKDNPELLEQYSQVRSGSRRFNVHHA